MTSRLPKVCRSTKAPAFLIQPRDSVILRELQRCPYLTTTMIEHLCSVSSPFPSRQALNRRLQRLYHHRFVNRIFRPCTVGSQEFVHVLDREGARQLGKTESEVNYKPASRLIHGDKLDHRLRINELRVALTCALGGQRGGCLAQWRDGHCARIQFDNASTAGSRIVRIIPDGFVVLAGSDWRAYYYVEADAGTEPSRVLMEKCQRYFCFWRTGAFAIQLRESPSTAFRVLFLVPSEQRLRTVLKVVTTSGAPARMFLVATQQHANPSDVFRPIWSMADGTKVSLLPGRESVG